MRRIFIWIMLTGFVLFCASGFFTFCIIHKQVDEITTIAKNNFNKNAIESLTDLINSGNFTFEEKNTAIWALGQFADKTALPVLMNLNSGISDQNRCNRKHELCKREIERAIKWCTKGNITNWMYTKINR